MPRPKGLPKTGGRQRGKANTKTREIANKAAESGNTPLEYMLEVMRSPFPKEFEDAVREGKINIDVLAGVSGWHSMRFEAAKAAAPYIHPRLQTTTVKGTGDDGAVKLVILGA